MEKSHRALSTRCLATTPLTTPLATPDAMIALAATPPCPTHPLPPLLPRRLAWFIHYPSSNHRKHHRARTPHHRHLHTWSLHSTLATVSPCHVSSLLSCSYTPYQALFCPVPNPFIMTMPKSPFQLHWSY